MENAHSTTVIIADSHEIVRESIADRLTSIENLSVIGQASDGYSTMKTCRQLAPDILLMDLSITRPAGIDVLIKLRKAIPPMKIILCSSDAKVYEAFNAISLGAIGFIPKQAKCEHFVNAIQSAAMGYSCIPSNYLDGFSSHKRNATKTGNIYGLSPREIEVLCASAQGAGTKEVAEQLDISVRTVETHRSSIYRKTASNKIADLVPIYQQL
ncbi:MAG: response regulator transcription factor [Pseudomonadota bacterium]